MTAAIGVPEERSALIYRYHEQLYRLALLVADDAESAAALVERAYGGLPRAGDPQAALVRGLLRPGPIRRARRRPWRYTVGAADLVRAGVERPQAEALLVTLAALPPVGRLIVGLHYLRGLAPPDIDALLNGAADGAQMVLANVRIGLARALGLLPTLIGDEVLRAIDRHAIGMLPADAAAELRSRMSAYPELRAARAGLAQAQDLLARALPALLAAAPPRDLLDRLLAEPAVRERRRLPRLAWAQVGLVVAVAAVIASIVVAPSLLGRKAPSSAVLPRTTAELIDASIHRLEHPPLQEGVLHEVYQATWSDQPAYLIERWYEYAAPHRLLVAVRLADDKRPFLAITSDGRGLVQYRTTNTVFGAEVNGPVDVHVSSDELAAVLPILRQFPSPGVYSSGPLANTDISRFFLAAARANQATFLGATIFMHRPAYLLAYRTNDPLPPPLSALFRAPRPAPHRVLLTIDRETYGLVDVAVLREGNSESVAQHPWRAQSIDVVAEAPDAAFALPEGPDIPRRDGLPSPHDPSISGARAPSEIVPLLRRPLLVPQMLPDPTMRGVLLAGPGAPSDPSDLRLLYDGAFVSMALLPSWSENGAPLGDDPRTAGAFRYQLLSSGVNHSALIGALAAPIDAPQQQVLVLLMEQFATPAEREATLRSVIASLVPLTAQNAAALEQRFYRPGAAGAAPATPGWYAATRAAAPGPAPRPARGRARSRMT